MTPVLPSLGETPKFRFGISAPLSGVLAEYGTAVRNGIELAHRDYPAELSRLEIVFGDSKWDSKSAVSAFKVLSEVKKVDLLYN